MRKAVLLVFFLLLTCVWNHAVFASDAKLPVILLDSGHNPPKSGAISVRGIYEFDYNDQFTAMLAEALRKASFHVELTRLPDKSIQLNARADLANRLMPELFLSLHHDSAQLVHLESFDINEITAYRTKKRITGYSIFVSRENAQFQHSMLFARQLGEHLLQLGRKPSLHHAENIEGENYELLDEALGIYQAGFVVLKKTKVPAVLLEVGVIVDEDDEAYISNPKNREKMVQAIVDAVNITVKKIRLGESD